MNSSRPAPVRDPKWVWFGCQVRYNAKTVSVLAIAETVAASALALYATFHWGAAKWFALCLALSPLLLLKTKRSVRRGLLWWDRFTDRVMHGVNLLICRKSEAGWFLGMIPASMLMAVASIPLKFVATVQVILTYPMLIVGGLSRNWWEQCLQKDLTALPELLPGAAKGLLITGGPDTDMASLEGMLKLLRDLADLDIITPPLRIIFWLVFSPFIVAIIVLGLGYRWCLKATSTFWVLLLFFSRPLRRRTDSLEWRIADIVKHPWNKLTRLWGLVVILMHGVVPLVYWQGYGTLVARLHELEPQMQYLIRFFLVPHSWDQGFPLSAWHVAGALSASLTWGLWWMAHYKRIALEAGRLSPAEQEKERRMIVGVMWVRSLLVSYTVFCGLVAICKTLHWTMPNVTWLP